MTDLCYLCGKPASKPLELASTFTSHSSCKVPKSDKMCDRCHSTIAGEQKQMWYWNEGKGKWSKLFGRSLSRIYQGETLIAPTVEGDKEGLPIVKNLLTRADIRSFLVNPPEPPFTLAIAETGQKHILPWAQEAESKTLFPVQFELDTLYLNHADFLKLLNNYEFLMGLGFSKTEIDSGDYRSDRLMKVMGDEFFAREEVIALHRGSRLLQLVSFVAVASEVPEPAQKSETIVPVGETLQLSLF